MFFLLGDTKEFKLQSIYLTVVSVLYSVILFFGFTTIVGIFIPFSNLYQTEYLIQASLIIFGFFTLLSAWFIYIKGVEADPYISRYGVVRFTTDMMHILSIHIMFITVLDDSFQFYELIVWIFPFNLGVFTLREIVKWLEQKHEHTVKKDRRVLIFFNLILFGVVASLGVIFDLLLQTSDVSAEILFVPFMAASSVILVVQRWKTWQSYNKLFS